MYRFGDCDLDPPRRELRRRGEPVHLEPQAFDLLVHLIEHRDQVVSKLELLDGVWGTRFLSEANLTTRVKEIRRAVGDDGSAQHTVRNVRGRGYRFVAALHHSEGVTQRGDTELVGRAGHLDQVLRAVQAGPFVTLVGPGGVGKTSLARAVLAQVDADGGATHFVDLTTIRQEGSVLPAVALAMGVVLDPVRPVDALATLARLGTLLVLDNCEHLAGEVTALVEQLLAVPRREARILATSRVRLGLGAERVVEVSPLTNEAARQLFDLRATAARADWDLASVPAERVEAVLTMLDRLPLTIEMAAARLGTMTFDDLAVALADGAPVLQLSHRSSSHRHRSLDSLVSWSVDLLDPPQRQTFVDLAAFAGVVSADDAAAVLETDPSVTRVMLADLAARSLLVAELTGSAARYRMLDTMRAAAAAALTRSGREAAVRERHARHVARAMNLADRAIRCHREPEGRQRAAELVAELRTAHRWARTHDLPLADELCATMWLYAYSTFWGEAEDWAKEMCNSLPERCFPGAETVLAGAAANRGELAVARERAHRAIAAGPPRVQANAWEILTDVAIYSGQFDDVVRSAERLAALAGDLDDPHHTAIAAVDRSLGDAFLGDPDTALAHVEGLDDPRLADSDKGWLLYARGEAMAARRDERALAAFAAAIDAGVAAGNAFVTSVAQQALGTEYFRIGDLARSLDAFATCLQAIARQGNHSHAVTALRTAVEPLFAAGESHAAVVAAIASSSQERRHLAEREADLLGASLAQAREILGDEEFHRCCDEGASLDIGEVVRLALAAVERARGTQRSA